MVVFNVHYGLTLVMALYNTHYQSTLSVTGFVVARSGLGLPGLLVTRCFEHVTDVVLCNGLHAPVTIAALPI